MASSTMLIAYFGPDQMLPLGSALAAAVGLILIGWSHIVGLVAKVWRLIFRRK